MRLNDGQFALRSSQPRASSVRNVQALVVYSALCRRYPGAEILITGVEDPDTRAHGSNESLHLAVFERACLAETLLLRNIAEAS